MKHIHEDICPGDINYEEFEKLCQDAWDTNPGYITINKVISSASEVRKECMLSTFSMYIFNNVKCF